MPFQEKLLQKELLLENIMNSTKSVNIIALFAEIIYSVRLQNFPAVAAGQAFEADKEGVYYKEIQHTEWKG